VVQIEGPERLRAAGPSDQQALERPMTTEQIPENFLSPNDEHVAILREVLPLLEAVQRMMTPIAAMSGKVPDDTLLNRIRVAIAAAGGAK
jgi:hypothetical protein